MIITKTAPLLALFALALALPISGCGKSKEQLALERMQNRKKPGMVRLVNLTDAPLSLYWMNRELGNPTAVGSYNRFSNLGYGKQKVGVGTNDKPFTTLEMEIGERDLHTIIAFGKAPDIHTAVVAGEFEFPTSTRNVQVFFVDENGKPVQGTVTLSSGSNKYELTDKSGGQMLAVGTYALSGPGIKSAEGGEVANENNYSLLVVKRSNGDFASLLMRNTYITKPVMAGAN